MFVFSEKPRLADNPKYKTRLCTKFVNRGICPYGRRCLFIHPTSTTEEDLVAALGHLQVKDRSPPLVCFLIWCVNNKIVAFLAIAVVFCGHFAHRIQYLEYAIIGSDQHRRYVAFCHIGSIVGEKRFISLTKLLLLLIIDILTCFYQTSLFYYFMCN